MNKLVQTSTSFLNKLASKKSDPILANFVSLGFIQGTNFLLGIVTFPYLVRTIGLENFGIVTFLQTIMIYFTVFSDYGFNLTATKDAAIHRNDDVALSKLFSEVISTRLLLALLSFLLLLSGLFLFDNLGQYALTAVLSFTIVLGQVIQPTWFFQGVERMKYITYTNILVRALYAVCIFVFITKEQDFVYVNFISGITAVVGGVLSICIIYYRFNVKFSLPGFADVAAQLRDGKSIFISSASVAISNNTNIVILGLFASPLTLGIYSVAEKLFTIFRTLAVILYQVVYPRICILANTSFAELSLFLNKLFKVIIALFLPISVLCFVLADYIVFLVSGKYIAEAAHILRIICFGPLLAALNIPVAQTMLAYKLSKQFALVVTIGAIVNVLLNFVLAYYFQAVGTAWSILITESVITIMLYVSLHKNSPQYSFFQNARIIRSLRRQRA